MIRSHAINRFQAALDLKARYEGMVPRDVMQAFIRSLIESDEQVPGRLDRGPGSDPLARVFVWSLNPFNEEELLFLNLDYAIRESITTAAENAAATWEEYVRLDRTGLAMDFFQAIEALAEYPDLETYLEQGIQDNSDSACGALQIRIWELCRQSDAAEEEDWDRLNAEIEALEARLHEAAAKEHAELSWPHERPVRLDDPFDRATFQEICFNHTIDLGNPQRDMYGMLPESIIKEFATLGESMWELGFFVQLKAKDKEAICAALDQLGYIPIEDAVLVDGACGMGPGLPELDSHIAFYESVRAMLDELDAGAGKRT